MPEKPPQTFAHHARYDPAFHFFVLPVFAITWVDSVVRAVRHPNLTHFWAFVFMSAVTVATFKLRIYALKVQDRVIRLEESLRLSTVLPETMRPQIGKLDEKRLVALRFASDDELPNLVERTFTENLKPKQIKQAIRNWRPDHWRV